MEGQSILSSPMSSSLYAEPIGLIGVVTGRVGPDTTGEVMLDIRGGREAFFAYPFDGQESIPEGIEVVVIDYKPPRRVLVSRITP